MKKFFIFLLVLTPFVSMADEYDQYFTTGEESQCETMINALLAKSTRNYVLKEVRGKDTNRRVYIYKGASEEKPDSVVLQVIINRFMKGANPELEIAGMPSFEIDIVRGPFLDVFPVWQIVDSEAVLEEVSKKYSVEKKTLKDAPVGVTYQSGQYGYTYTFKKEKDGIWKFRRF